jgi:hypothetical protein
MKILKWSLENENFEMVFRKMRILEWSLGK